MGQIHEMVEKQEQTDRIAEGDHLDMFAAIMPYLLQRREIARRHYSNPTEGLYNYMQEINKKIGEILCLF